MTQRDLIKDQVEQLGRVFGKITALLLDLDTSGNIETSFSEIEHQLTESIGLTLSNIISLPENEFEGLLETKLHGDEKAIEKLAYMLWQIGNLKNDRFYLEKAFAALKFVDLNSQYYSIERTHQLEDLKDSLNRF